MGKIQLYFVTAAFVRTMIKQLNHPALKHFEQNKKVTVINTHDGLFLAISRTLLNEGKNTIWWSNLLLQTSFDLATTLV